VVDVERAFKIYRSTVFFQKNPRLRSILVKQLSVQFYDQRLRTFNLSIQASKLRGTIIVCEEVVLKYTNPK
jgi:hypothetical protein